jgi:protein SCO1/2
MSLSRIVELLEGFLAGARFPVMALSFTAAYELLLGAVLVAPPGPQGFAAFAAQFRVWCFNADPGTGRMDPAVPFAFLLPPLLLAALCGLLWAEPLRAAWRRPRRLALDVAAGALVVGLCAAGFAVTGAASPRGELPFPAEALRIAARPPAIRLTDQNGAQVELSALHGRVVVLTAVYASCTSTCGRILAQARDALDELAPEERSRVSVLAVTLDPEHDTPAALAGLARVHGLDGATFHLLSGPPDRVERVLDRMDVSRQRDPVSGVIEHANLFLVIDPEGRLAYRFTLGERQQRWLVSALRALLHEAPRAG